MRCNNTYCAYCKNKDCQLEEVNFSNYGICENMLIHDEKHKKIVDDFITLVES